MNKPSQTDKQPSPNARRRTQDRVRDPVHIAVFAVILAVCSWISVPGPVPFTLQTFGVFLAVTVLGGKKGTVSVLLYITMGIIGIPVFSGFSGGIGCLFQSTGGYILGFLLSALSMWLMERVCGRSDIVLIASMAVGLIVCYAFGTAFFVAVYARNAKPMGVMAALSLCVFPYIIPDAVKLAMAFALGKRLGRIVQARQR